MPALNGEAIQRRVFGDVSPEKRLVVTPLLEPRDQIQPGSSSLDLRLGCHFIFQRRTNVAFIDAAQEKTPESYHTMEQREYIPFGKHLVLHPKQFVLGGTVEYLAMPLDLTGYVVGRSSWGRLGLIVATAIGVHPGYHGIILLELTNVGEVPFYLRPGRTIAQLFLHVLENPASAGGVSTRYFAAVLPESSQVGPDRDLKIVNRIGEQAAQSL